MKQKCILSAVRDETSTSFYSYRTFVCVSKRLLVFFSIPQEELFLKKAVCIWGMWVQIKRKFWVVLVGVIYPPSCKSVSICIPCHKAEAVMEATLQL